MLLSTDSLELLYIAAGLFIVFLYGLGAHITLLREKKRKIQRNRELLDNHHPNWYE